MLATGQRRGEIIKAAWSHVDFEKKDWFIPTENSKNGKEHHVPLSTLALDLFQQLLSLRQNDWVMPSPKGNTHMSEKAITRAVARYQEFIGLEKWTPHDLRRTCATKLSELKVPPHVVEKVLNHTLEGNMEVYNRFDYMPERVEALEKWSQHLTKILEKHNREQEQTA